MPPSKRSTLQSANPVKRLMGDDAVDLLSEAVDSELHCETVSDVVRDGSDAGRAAANAMISDGARFQNVSIGLGAVACPKGATEHAASPESPSLASHAFDRANMDTGSGDVLSDMSAHSTPPHRGIRHDHAAAVAPTVPHVQPQSPVSNRDRFRQGLLPARTCCNLDLCRAPAGSKITLTAICIAVFPAQTNPDRRYVQLADVSGTVGVTVWNHNVAKFSSSSVGMMVTLQKVTITNHQGKKNLTLARDSTVDLTADNEHPVMVWWKSLLQNPTLSCGNVHDIDDNLIVNVCGIAGHVTSEVKMVNGAEKTLTFMHMVDSSGKLDIRSWNHSPDSLMPYVDRPCLIQRVRVTSFAGTKHAELLDGTASVIQTSFPGSTALQRFWAE